MRLAIDTGGTFTDLVIDDGDDLAVHKRPTTLHDPVDGILDVLAAAAQTRGVTRRELLGTAESLVHGTTHALNALLTGRTARTALLVTAGHPDILLLREGGREHFNVRAAYPEPYVPRSLTFELPERIGSSGGIVTPLREADAREVLSRLADRGVEAVAVCLLWSIVNPVHEARVGALLEELLPGLPYTLSHRLSPTLREYRRASSTAIDASLKPLMGRYLATLESRLRDAGFAGRLFMVTSSGGMLDIGEVAHAPIHAIKSGPAMAPVAAGRLARDELERSTAIVTDTGGTSYDVSVVRDGRVPWTRETWLARPHLSPMIGFPSVDVRSYGAGGGSIAWVDAGGLLHVGPTSAGADPGPAAYGRGGTLPTFTDAALVLGHIDPDDFLGGRIRLDARAAEAAIEREVGARLGLGAVESASAIRELITEQMVRAIEDAVVRQGVEPGAAVLVGGGGAAGLNTVAIARRAGCPRVLIPRASAALSAAGALMSDLAQDFRITRPARSAGFDFEGVAQALDELRARAERFIAGAGIGAAATGIEFFAEAHYPREVWEIEVEFEPPLAAARDVEALSQAFHRRHEQLYAVSDPGAPIEIVSWRARARCALSGRTTSRVLPRESGGTPRRRRAYFEGTGWLAVDVHDVRALPAKETIAGPAIVTSLVTTTVIDPGACATVTASGSLAIDVELPDAVSPGSAAATIAPGPDGSLSEVRARRG